MINLNQNKRINVKLMVKKKIGTKMIINVYFKSKKKKKKEVIMPILSEK